MPIFAVNEMSGMTDGTPPPIVYIDANPFIYFIDGEESGGEPVAGRSSNCCDKSQAPQ